MNPFEKPQSSDPFDVLAKVTGIRTPKRQVSSIDRAALKELVNADEWEQIGKLFGFVPHWTAFHQVNFFDWTSCNAAFWEVFQPVAKGAISPGRAHLKAIAENEQNRLTISRPIASAKHPPQSKRRSAKVNVRILYVLQEGRCFYCRHKFTLPQFSIDHRLALSKGGVRHISNEVAACRPCNHQKADRREEVFVQSDWLARRRADRTDA